MAIRYQCSDGEMITEAVVRSRYASVLKKKHTGRSVVACAACGVRQAVHNDHTIAKARCKHLRKTELIYHLLNFENSCEICHSQWESYKDGEWLLHKNVEKRLAFLKEHDPEGYLKRVEFTRMALEEKLDE